MIQIMRRLVQKIFNFGEVFPSPAIMDPEDAGNDPKALLDTVVWYANNNENSVLPKAASIAQPGPELHTKNGPDMFLDIEGQIALDSFLSGRSEIPLIELLARIEDLEC